MADILLPGFTQVDLGADVRGGTYDETMHPKLGWHSTEGSSVAGARNAFKDYPPHLCYDPKNRQREQYVALNRYAYSFYNGEADDEFVIQLELVGFAGQMHLLSDEHCKRIYEDVVKPLEDAIGLPRVVIPGGFHGEGEGFTLASTESPIRISLATLRGFSGHLGHQHIPGDSHWDPGRLPIAKILSYAKPGSTPGSPLEDDMPTVDEFWNRPVPVHPDADDPDQRTEVEADEALGWTNKAAWEAVDLGKANAIKLDALLGRPAGGEIDEAELAKQLLEQGLANDLGRMPADQFKSLVKAISDENDRRDRIRANATVADSIGQ
jgi:hypothetical protein